MTRIDDAIANVAQIFDCLILLRGILETGRDCNTCKEKCGHVKPGQQVAWNCPLWKGDADE